MIMNIIDILKKHEDSERTINEEFIQFTNHLNKKRFDSNKSLCEELESMTGICDGDKVIVKDNTCAQDRELYYTRRKDLSSSFVPFVFYKTKKDGSMSSVEEHILFSSITSITKAK